MDASTLDILRCPYCGGRLELVESMFYRRDGAEIRDGILGCHCCIFPVVDGIPVLHLEGPSTTARGYVESGRPDLARRVMFNLQTDELAARFDQLASSGRSTYAELVESIDPTPEGRYFLYRFSDPSYTVAQPLVRAVAGAVLRGGGRAIDICGGSGHLTRLLFDLSSGAPVLADLYFSKVWLARRFTVPGVEAVCCDANAPLPFSRGAFRYAMCADAFMFVWTKRQFVQEMLRLIDDPDAGAPAAAVITHAHNALVWSPSHGNPLPPAGYYDLFEGVEPRIFAEARLFEDVIRGRPLDLSRRDSADVLEKDPALTIVASRMPRREDVFRPHAVDRSPGMPGELRINPLYVAAAEGDRVRLQLRFPSEDYAEEFGACREYLPDEVIVTQSALDGLSHGRIDGELTELARRRVILELPERYY